MLKSITSFFLMFLLLLPNLAQALHILDEHSDEHFCTEKNTHIHEKENKCILEYTFTNPFVDIQKKSTFQVKDQIILEDVIYKDQFLLKKFITGKNLRAPPFTLLSIN